MLSDVTIGNTNGGPTLTLPGDDPVYSFNGRNDLSENWLVMSSDVKEATLSKNDDFVISMWLFVEAGSASSYIFSYEINSESYDRYFSFFEATRRCQIFYNRDRIPGAGVDEAVGSRVGLSFYYNTDHFPVGLSDGILHFVAITVNFPEITVTIDGIPHYPTQGHYFDDFDNRQDLDRLTDGTFYEMPAPLRIKDASLISSIDARIGGSERGNRFALHGFIRQMTFTDLLTTAEQNCIATCGDLVLSDDSNLGFTTTLNPVTRQLTFTGSFSPEVYTFFLQSLVYSSDGSLPSQVDPGVEEGREVRITVSSSCSVQECMNHSVKENEIYPRAYLGFLCGRV